MVKNLVIVESPAKAKTIEKFLGKEFTVKSCFGHIRDLAPDKLSVDVEGNFEPHYQIPADKKKIVAELKKLAKAAETVWLATDEDREGEAISWHLAEALELKETKDVRRIVFHEITKKAILGAIENPRSINAHLVDAQQARRILDRLVGFEVSPILWRKIKPALSAGRVQSVAVRLIVDREREIINFEVSAFYKVAAILLVSGKDGKKTELKAELPGRYQTEAEAKDFLEKCVGADYTIAGIEVKPAKKTPAPPFTTSTLQQEASRKLSFSVARTMMIAQKLYELGHITYMRTDSTSLSDFAIASASEQIKKQYGFEYAKTRQYATKSKGAQEAHEAIRPTDMGAAQISGDAAGQRLYELIWKRTIASQMADAILEKTTVKIEISTTPEHLQAQGEVLKFDGFLKVYFEGKDDEDEEGVTSGILPPLSKGQKLELKEMVATQRFTRPPARYTEASLVRKLEELGIGRPSTYAPTISTIQKRDYVAKETREGQLRNFVVLSLKNDRISEGKEQENFGAEKSKLFPTNTGMVVNDFLQSHFDNIMDYAFTAKVEKEFDEIASGEMEWHDMIKRFYGPFHERVEETIVTKDKSSRERLIGKDPESGKNIYGKIGRYGPYVQKGEGGEGEEKPDFAKLRKGQLLETITIDEVMELFDLPRTVGEFEGEELAVDIGRFGPYVRHSGKFYSLPKEVDPFEVDNQQAIDLVKEKREQQAKQNIKSFEHDGTEIKVLNGRYGPYISVGKNNVRIPKKMNPEDITLEEALELISNHKSKPKGRRRSKKS